MLCYCFATDLDRLIRVCHIKWPRVYPINDENVAPNAFRLICLKIVNSCTMVQALLSCKILCILMLGWRNIQKEHLYVSVCFCVYSYVSAIRGRWRDIDSGIEKCCKGNNRERKIHKVRSKYVQHFSLLYVTSSTRALCGIRCAYYTDTVI